MSNTSKHDPITARQDMLYSLGDVYNRSVKARVPRLLERLQNWPDVSGAKPLAGKLAGKFRMRTGDYRLQFAVLGNKLFVEKVGHRDGFYED